jgi:hypothetical protein
MRIVRMFQASAYACELSRFGGTAYNDVFQISMTNSATGAAVRLNQFSPALHSTKPHLQPQQCIGACNWPMARRTKQENLAVFTDAQNVTKTVTINNITPKPLKSSGAFLAFASLFARLEYRTGCFRDVGQHFHPEFRLGRRGPDLLWYPTKLACANLAVVHAALRCTVAYVCA